MTPKSGGAPALSASDFRALHDRHQVHGWGPSDRRGALDNITPAAVLAVATNELRLGRAVSLAADIDTSTTADNPEPARHQMTGPPDCQAATHGLDFAIDRLTMNIHGNADSHLDALCHVIYDEQLYSVDAGTMTPGGATALAILQR